MFGPAVALAWEMLDEAMRASPEFFPAATCPGAIVILDVPDAAWGEEIATAWRRLTDGAAPEAAKTEEQRFTGAFGEEDEGTTSPGWKSDAVEIQAFKIDALTFREQLGAFRSGLRRGRPVYAVTADAAAFLHPDVIAAVDARLTVPRPTAEQLLAMVRKRFRGFDGELPVPSAAAMDLLRATDIFLADRRQQSPGGFIKKLEQLALARQRPRAPGLETLHGMGEAGDWGRRMAADLRAYAEKRLSWDEIERGIVLVGPPGCGKTSFARAFASSAEVAFLPASLQEWQGARDGHLGTTLGAMRASFDEARRLAPCVLLIDEIDSFGSRAGASSYHREYHTQVVNSFLEQLDGAKDREGVVVIACTNDATNLDPAILRAGRLERVISVPLPDEKALEAILRQNLGAALADADLGPLAEVAYQRHATGADIAGWCRAARAAARAARRQLVLDDLAAEIGEAPPPLTEAAKRRVAIHEAGHVIGCMACGAGVFVGVSMNGRRGSIGSTLANLWQVGDTTFLTRKLLRRQLRALLAGRAAEAELLNAVSSGAGGSKDSDLALATRLALTAVAAWGLDGHQSAVVWRGAETKKDTEALLTQDTEVRGRVTALLGEGMVAARRLIRCMRPAALEIAEALLERGHLDTADATEIVDRHFRRLRAKRR